MVFDLQTTDVRFYFYASGTFYYNNNSTPTALIDDTRKIVYVHDEDCRLGAYSYQDVRGRH